MAARKMTVLRIGYDAQAFLSPNGGLGKGLQLRNLLGPRIESFTGFASTFPNSSGMKLVQEGASRHGIWQQVSLPGSLRRHKIDIFLAPQNTAPFFLPSSVRLILVLHDTILLHSFQRFELNLRDAFRRRQIRASVSRAEVVLTVSQYSRSEILRAFPQANVRVIPCTIPEAWFDAAPSEVRNGFLLMVTSSAPHKNAAGGIAGYAHYARAAGRSAVPLKIVGLARERGSYMPMLRDLGVRDLVSFTPFLSEADLRDLYRQANALILPSFVEGFGIPLLEAMATGTPALASNVSSLPEVGGSAPLYFNPHSPAEIGSAITTVMTDSTLRHRMVQLGLDRAKTFHPSIVMRLVDDFWREFASQ
jgi:glycosyltransferase involved in cell wall biosynthesis